MIFSKASRASVMVTGLGQAARRSFAFDLRSRKTSSACHEHQQVMSERIFRVKFEARVHCSYHLGFASVSRVPLPASPVELVELHVGNFLSGEVSSFRFDQPRSLGCATCLIDMPLEVERHFCRKHRRGCVEAWGRFLHVDEGLDGL